MTANGTQTDLPGLLRRVESPAATELAGLCSTFEDLQTVLLCCERLVTELARSGHPAVAGGPEEVVVEAAWTTALLSYGRCFRVGALTAEDAVATHPDSEVLEWHTVLLKLRDHYADPAVNPRERFSVGVAQDSIGAASGVAVTSIRQPLVDEVTVRQMGAVTYALSAVVDARIAAGQAALFEEVKKVSAAELDALEPLDIGTGEPLASEPFEGAAAPPGR